MLVLPFSYNWNNKLDCKAFTTIRLYQPAKHIPGIEVDPVLKGQSKGISTLMEVKVFYLHQLNNYISYLDTGYNVADCTAIIKNMYPAIDFKTKQLALLLIVKK